MSIRERLEAELVNHGLWPEEATETLNKAEVAKENTAISAKSSRGGYHVMQIWLFSPSIRFKNMQNFQIH